MQSKTPRERTYDRIQDTDPPLHLPTLNIPVTSNTTIALPTRSRFVDIHVAVAVGHRLADVARPDFVNDCPSGWRIVRIVRIVQAARFRDADLAPIRCHHERSEEQRLRAALQIPLRSSFPDLPTPRDCCHRCCPILDPEASSG